MSDANRHDSLLRMLELSWEAPPAAAHAATRRIPDFEPAPGLGEGHATERWKPEDVRGTDLLVPETPVSSVHSFSHADAALRVVPPTDQGLWRIEGRIWLHEPREGMRFLVVLSQDDHVLDQCELEDGSPFVFEEALGTGWSIEAHVPGRAPLVVEDPRA